MNPSQIGIETREIPQIITVSWNLSLLWVKMSHIVWSCCLPLSSLKRVETHRSCDSWNSDAGLRCIIKGIITTWVNDCIVSSFSVHMLPCILCTFLLEKLQQNKDRESVLLYWKLLSCTCRSVLIKLGQAHKGLGVWTTPNHGSMLRWVCDSEFGLQTVDTTALTLTLIYKETNNKAWQSLERVYVRSYL